MARTAIEMHRHYAGLVPANQWNRRQAALYATAEVIRDQADAAQAAYEAARTTWAEACKRHNAAYSAARRLPKREQAAAFATLPSKPASPPEDIWPAILAARAIAIEAKSRADSMTGGYIGD